MSFVALTLNARALDVAGIGVLFLIQATCELTSRLLAFQNWQAVVKFGAEAVQANDPARLRATWRFGFFLDLIAAVAATTLAVALLLLAPRLVGLDPRHGALGLAYAASLLLSGSGSSIGALRLLDRFGMVVGANVISAAALLANAIVLWAFAAPLWVYLVSIPAITATISGFLIVAGYFRTQHAADAMDDLVATPLDRQQFFRFALGVSAVGTLSVIRQRGELVVVGAILGPSAAALYGVAYRMAALMDRVAESGRQSVYPVISQLVADGAFPKALALAFRLSRIGLLVCIPGLFALALFGGDILRLLFGTEYVAAKSNLILLGAGAALYLITFPLGPLIQISLGAGRFLLLTIVASICFLIFGLLGPWLYGQEAAGAGAAAFGVALAVLSVGQLLLRLRSFSGKEAPLSSRQIA
jgi:O-antigen/teichoic acid export membrane protein